MKIISPRVRARGARIEARAGRAARWVACWGVLSGGALDRAEARVRLGAQVGTATGVSAQVELGARDALNLSLAYDLRHSWALIGADYRLLASPFRGGRGGLYWGVGGVMGGRGDRASYLSARLPLGLEVQPAGWPVQLFLEGAPALALLPATGVGVMGALGARWTF